MAVLGLGVVLMAICAVLIDITIAVISRQSAQQLADSAAMAAAQEVDTAEIYRGRTRGRTLPISCGQARKTAVAHVNRFGSATSQSTVHLDCDGRTVTVEVGVVARLPFAGRLGVEPQVLVTGEARARTVVLPGER